MLDVGGMRNNHSKYVDELYELAHNFLGDVLETRIEVWGDCEYAVISNLRPTEEPQTLDVVKLSGSSAEVAKFSMAWPDQGHRRYCIVLVPDEGAYYLVLREDGGFSQFRGANLPIRVTPGTQEDYEAMIEGMAEDGSLIPPM